MQARGVIASFFPPSRWGGEVKDPGNEVVLAVACTSFMLIFLSLDQSNL